MTFAQAVFWSIFWLVIAAALGGLIIYFMFRNRVKVLTSELNTLRKSFDKHRSDCETKQKELDLEIRARDRKLEIAQGDFNNLQAKLEEKDRALQVEVSGRMNVQNELFMLQERFKTLEVAKSSASTAVSSDDSALITELNREIERLKIMLDDKDNQWEVETKRRDEVEHKYRNLKNECAQAQNNLKNQLKAKEEELSLFKTGANKATTIVATVQEEKPIEKTDDKKEQALARVREKAKSFDYSRIGVASADDKDDLKIIVGIGPFIEEKLHALGIYTFEQVSKFTDEDVEQVTAAIEFFPGRIQRDNWISQAAELWGKKKQG
jgi:predicted flap endonuclease-1-like 5' DNA nuclease